jgi:hypothetical protein
MVARIDTSGPLAKGLNYNEHKVQQGRAQLIHAGNFLTDAGQLNFYQKKERFDRQNSLSSSSQKNTMHAQLSFDPSEKLTDQQLVQIANRYLEGLGMQEQPYLVYRHTDTDVPHVHILASLIRNDATRVKTQFIGRDKSEPVRKAIEQEFKLIHAQKKTHSEDYRQKPVEAKKIQYGEKPTKQALQNVVRYVTEEYSFTSLQELNAILRQYNVKADPGEKTSRTFKHAGLHYKVLDDQGNAVGVPIKASSFWFKPTQKKLEEKYEANKQTGAKHLPDLKARIDFSLHQSPDSLQAFTELLKKESIDLMAYQAKDGRIHGLTYVDHKNKVAVKGSVIGKAYSAVAIQESFAKNQRQRQQQTNEQVNRPQVEGETQSHGQPKTLPQRLDVQKGNQFPRLESPAEGVYHAKTIHHLSDLLTSAGNQESTPQELQQKQRKKKKQVR